MKINHLKITVLNRALARQTGVSLVVSMVFILILAFLGLAAMRNSTLQERMANNMRDRNIALQAAELALRDAERDLSSFKADGVTFCIAGTGTCRPIGERPTNPADRADYWVWGPSMTAYWTPTCNHGQCYLTSSTTVPPWDDSVADWTVGQIGNSLKTVKYGKYTGANYGVRATKVYDRDNYHTRPARSQSRFSYDFSNYCPRCWAKSQYLRDTTICHQSKLKNFVQSRTI